ncbi:MAG: HD domain-containing protein [Mariniphaga sp.]
MQNKYCEIIQKTEKYVRFFFENEGSGHDWWHVFRVRNYALKIADYEGGNLFLIEMAALLHDLDDWKLNKLAAENKTEKWLKKLSLQNAEISKIMEIISQVSFKGAGVETKPTTTEASIVQDADRLDAIGAIGIARTFAYGGNKNRLIYHPEIGPEKHESFDAYKKSSAPTINHFYEKLLLLKDRMNTATGKQMAQSRHRFMEKFLEQFFNEWEMKI